MYDPRFELAIFEGPTPTAADIEIFRIALDALVRVNVVHIRAGRVPPLETAIARGLVRYVDPGTQDDPWSDAVCCLRRGTLDCEDASAWYVADQIARNGRRDARCGFTITPTADGRRSIHIFARVGGVVVDPSRWAGMR